MSGKVKAKMIEQVLPIVLRYDEAGVTDKTMECLHNAGFKFTEIAERDGVGSMARAFNEQMTYDHDYKYIWFITNVTFTPDLPQSLFEAMEENPKAAAVHPGMESSHGFINNAKGVTAAHFIEWTAPMVRLNAWNDVGELDTRMPYVHFDLDWSHRAKLKDWGLLIDGRVRVEHRYLHLHKPERISEIRAELRRLKHQSSLDALNEKWGPNAIKKLCVGGSCG